MARDYTHLHGYYLHGHEMPPHHTYHHYDHQHGAGSEAGTFEVTAGAGAAEALAHAPHHLHHDAHKRNNSYGSEGYKPSSCDASLPAPPAPPLAAASATRKRKTSSYGTASAYDDDGGDDSQSSHAPDKKQNHSEIEKRRRDKMNTYIAELSSMVPMCGAMARKLDKLTVLRMAVQHLRSVRGALSACPLAARPRPAFLSEREVNSLILHAAQDCFLLVVGCDRGRLLYVSASVKRMLHYDQSELLGQSLFDILHPKDVAKVKEQLSSSDLSPRERLIDAKTMLPVKADVVSASCLCLGARRSFFCRIKCKSPPDAATSAPSAPPAAPPAPPASSQVKEETEPTSKMRKKNSEKKYCVVQCTGYLKSWAPAEVDGAGAGSGAAEEGEACNLSCLVAVGRALPDLAPPAAPAAHAPHAPARRLQYVSRHAPDGKFLFVDQRVTLALGFLPQELLGTSLYEYMSGPELSAVARAHKDSLMRREPLHTPPYCFRKKDGTYARITTHFKPFRNPWTKDVECLVANNTVVADPPPAACLSPAHCPCPSPAAADAFPLYKHTSVDDGEDDDWSRYLCGGAGGSQRPRGSGGAGGSLVERRLSSEGEGEDDMRRLIETQVESHKIGAAIVEEALRRTSTEQSPDLSTDLLHDVVFPNQTSLVDSILGAEVCYGQQQVRNNVALSAAAGCSPPAPASPPAPSPPLPPLALDGNGEAAMAVIMSLLEADAGLGGPVNFSGLPWPLP